MSSFIIKLFALLFMSVDHVGIVLFNNNQVFRFIGRASFPLYAFLLVEGFKYTKDNKKRLIRYVISILLLAVISEPIYNISLHDSLTYPFSQNILFTLFVSLICMIIYEKNSYNIMSKIISIFIIIYIALLSYFSNFDYGFLGIMLIFGYYLISKLNYKKIYYIILYTLYISLHIFIYNFSFLIFGVLFSLIFIFMYNHKKGYNPKILQYFFYIYYPLHLLILLLLK